MGFDFDPEEQMYRALTEILGVDEYIIQLINPLIGEDTGGSHENWHYGYYFEFPDYNDLDEEVKDEISNELILKLIPFGKTMYVSDGELSGTQADPLGWRADFEAEEYYQTMFLPKEKVIQELDEIIERISLSSDSLIVKALIISAFSITESYVRTVIWQKIPSYTDGEIDSKLAELLNKHISEELSRTDGRERIYKQFSGKKLEKIPFNEPFRNSLAHDIGIGSINEGVLTVKDKKYEKHSEEINDILKSLKDYVYKLE